MVTVATLCVALSVWYSVRTRHVMSELEAASRRTLDKSAAVSAEKKRSDRILHQLMPRAVVLQLKVGQHLLHSARKIHKFPKVEFVKIRQQLLRNKTFRSVTRSIVFIANFY